MPRRKRPDERAAQALVAIRAGANDEDAALYAGVDLETFQAWLDGPWGAEVAKAKADLSVYAATVIRQAVGADANLAQRIVDRHAAGHELERLRRVSGVGE